MTICVIRKSVKMPPFIKWKEYKGQGLIRPVSFSLELKTHENFNSF